jgi:carboxyl-terminal processing protease
MRSAFPAAPRVSGAGPVGPAAAGSHSTGIGIDSVHEAALGLLNGSTASGDDTRVVQAAINGLFAALDPHSGYMDAQAFRDMQVQTRGSFGGLGVEVTMEHGSLKVVTPLDDTPASKAGLISNDIVTHLDDAPLAGLSLSDAVARMRGPVGSRVKLTIRRAGREQPLDLTIVRDTIRIRPVRTRIEGGDVAYIRITQFNEQTAGELRNAIAAIKKQVPANRLKGYVIDLRKNPGGLLDQAVQVADEFLGRGEVVSIRGRRPEDTQRFAAKAGDATAGKRIVVLLDGGSAAASEIVAGALQDHRRATVVGTRSFGKGSVQTIIPLGGDLGAMRLTTAMYYTPSGRSIQARGIVPDIEVQEEKPDETVPSGEAALPGHLRSPPDPRDDKPLARALENLRTASR